MRSSTTTPRTAGIGAGPTVALVVLGPVVGVLPPRGSFYSHSRAARGGTASRTRRRETTPEDALADARAALERAIGAIDREVEDADTRAKEAKAEADALKRSSTGRKAEITKRLEALS